MPVIVAMVTGLASQRSVIPVPAQALASRLLDYGDAEEASKALSEVREIAETEGQETQLRGNNLETAGRIALAREDPGTASRQLSEAILWVPKTPS